MKSSTHHSFLDRRAWIAAAMTVLLGAAPGFAQTSSSTDTGSSSTSGTSGTYGAGSTGSSDTSSTTGSTATGATDPSSSTTSTTGTTGASGTTGSTSVTGSTTDTSTTGGATTMTGRTSSDKKLGWMDRRFVTKAADSGTTEINLAKLATERASNPEVKSFAQKLVDDHTQVSKELKALASQKNVELDEEDLGSDRAYNRLSKKTGMEFDQEFVEHMVEQHEDDVERFEEAASDAKDSDLRAFASKHVGHLREHLQKAQSLRSSIMPTGRTDNTDTSTSTSTDSTSRSGISTDPTSSTGSTTDTSTGTTGTGSTDTSTSTGSTTDDTDRSSDTNRDPGSR